MLRQMLALLAVISGLTLVAEPARALEGHMVSVAEVMGEEGDCLQVAAPLRDMQEIRTARPGAVRALASASSPTATPRIRLKADRARE